MQDCVVLMLQVPARVGHWALLVHALVVWILHRLLTFGHWLSAEQAAPVLEQVPGTTGHCALLKHAVPVWMLHLPAIVGHCALD